MREDQVTEVRWSDLLDEVEKGETVVITREGRPVARMVPEAPRGQAGARDVFEEIRAFRETLPKITIEEILAWRHEGHDR